MVSSWQSTAPGPQEGFRFLSYLQVSLRDVDSGVWRTRRGQQVGSRGRTFQAGAGSRGRREASPLEASWVKWSCVGKLEAGTAWRLVHSIRFCPTHMGRRPKFQAEDSFSKCWLSSCCVPEDIEWYRRSRWCSKKETELLPVWTYRWDWAQQLASQQGCDSLREWLWPWGGCCRTRVEWSWLGTSGRCLPIQFCFHGVALGDEKDQMEWGGCVTTQVQGSCLRGAGARAPWAWGCVSGVEISQQCCSYMRPHAFPLMGRAPHWYPLPCCALCLERRSVPSVPSPSLWSCETRLRCSCRCENVRPPHLRMALPSCHHGAACTCPRWRLSCVVSPAQHILCRDVLRDIYVFTFGHVAFPWPGLQWWIALNWVEPGFGILNTPLAMLCFRSRGPAAKGDVSCGSSWVKRRAPGMEFRK